jgi:hypothetical protein
VIPNTGVKKIKSLFPTGIRIPNILSIAIRSTPFHSPQLLAAQTIQNLYEFFFLGGGMSVKMTTVTLENVECEVDVRKHLGIGSRIVPCNFFAFLFFIAAFREMDLSNYYDV